MKTTRFFQLTFIPCAVLLTSQVARAGKATWNAQPVDGEWFQADNWTPAKVPEEGAAAVFGVSGITEISIARKLNIHRILFEKGASAYIIGIALPGPSRSRNFEGPIVNLSGIPQNFVNPGAETDFRENASAGKMTVFINSAGQQPGELPSNLIFYDSSSAEEATIIAEGAAEGNYPASVVFFNSSTAARATLIANGGVDGGPGSQISFSGDSTGDNARVELFGNGSLSLSFHSSPGVTIGSLEGDGNVVSVDNNLTIGTNNRSTIFSGSIFGGHSSITKVGTGVLFLTGANNYTGGTTVTAGTLRVGNNKGSATGRGPVSVDVGVLAGAGIIEGEVTIGTGVGSGAYLYPQGAGPILRVLTISNSLTFNADATCGISLDSDSLKSDQVSASGVTINTGAVIIFDERGSATLPPGATFTILSNTAATPIAGTFANLSDGAVVTVGTNNFQASYEGGDGNDLTLTVIP